MLEIKILEKNTAEQIAAGEVIENPSSVVKELVENALDAGATKIDVELANGGKALLSVTDNGHGISASELPLAFKRFATSKLTVIEDLDHLSSLGFRGEALPSIAAVARIKMTTRAAGALSGSVITLEGGEVVEQEEVGAPFGTRVEVRNLFYNTPGRLKFLRADAVESTRVSALLSEMSLAHPKTAFALKSGKRNLFNSSGDGIVLHAIASLYGSETAEAMLELKRKDTESGCSLHGYTSAPFLTRSSRRWIILIVNGRLIRNPLMVSALERAYGDLLPRQRHPLAVLFIDLPSGNIDVNVHPAKTEIRFREPEVIKSLIYRAVKMTLQGELKLPQWPERIPQERYKYDRSNTQQQNLKDISLDEQSTHDDEQYREQSQFFQKDSSQQYGEYMAVNESEAKFKSCRLIGQFLQSYLVVQKEDCLLLIDQHAAHERINYHQLIQSENPVKKQERVQLTIPLTVNLPVTWRSEMPRLLPLLSESGFELESIGEDSYVIRSVPFLLSSNVDSSQLYDLLEMLITAGYNSDAEYREAILKTIACHRAVKAKQALTRQEMEILLKEWENTPHAEYCPHGRPTVISFDRTQLEKGFHRKGNRNE